MYNSVSVKIKMKMQGKQLHESQWIYLQFLKILNFHV